MALCHQITIEPVPTMARFIDNDQVWGCGWQLGDELITVSGPGADGAEGDHRGVGGLGDISPGARVLVDISTNREGARLWHG
jgi:hypothetical protein